MKCSCYYFHEVFLDPQSQNSSILYLTSQIHIFCLSFQKLSCSTPCYIFPSYMLVCICLFPLLYFEQLEGRAVPCLSSVLQYQKCLVQNNTQDFCIELKNSLVKSEEHKSLGFSTGSITYWLYDVGYLISLSLGFLSVKL